MPSITEIVTQPIAKNLTREIWRPWSNFKLSIVKKKKSLSGHNTSDACKLEKVMRYYPVDQQIVISGYRKVYKYM